ncbi:hypothetical protein KP509_33G064000 [Ceratopteris richardii]|uniref:Pentatricopeptide repeat-containing protein n=1 Tax=Ceratopteris richardii TaxID=49495 RepID=A0A8T2QQI6_CERRI|nr:hypothetical protein KP509_33G064000 [Ceratopteris richardii]
MPGHGSLRKAVAHSSSLIASYVHSRHPRESLQPYFSMLDDGVQPDLCIFLLLFKACGNIRNLEHDKALHLHAHDLGLVSDPFVASTLLSMFGKYGSLHFSEEVFHEFPEHQRDVVLWNSMLSAYSEQGHGERGYI